MYLHVDLDLPFIFTFLTSDGNFLISQLKTS